LCRTVGAVLGDGDEGKNDELLADMESAGVSMLSGRVLGEDKNQSPFCLRIRLRFVLTQRFPMSSPFPGPYQPCPLTPNVSWSSHEP
jgi:hypothetical protein